MGEGLRGSNGACSTLCQVSVTQLLTIKLGPSSADSQVGGLLHTLGPCGSLQWALLWGWEFLLLPQPPQVFSSQRFWVFISLRWNPGLHGLSCFPVVPPSLSAHKCGTALSASCCLTWSISCRLACPGPPAAALARVLSTWLPVSTPPTGLDEYFFFDSLIVRLPYSSIFCQFWLFFVFKFVVVLLLVVQGGTVCLSMPPSCPEVLIIFEFWFFHVNFKMNLPRSSPNLVGSFYEVTLQCKVEPLTPWYVHFVKFIYVSVRSVLRFSSRVLHTFFLLLFKYSCLHFPPTTLTNPSHPHSPPLILPLFGFAHVSFIHVPENPVLFSPHFLLPPPPWLLSVCS